ncbi:hypothetical protein GCM10029978_112820 [Actinoallomurus acanthiterrae]
MTKIGFGQRVSQGMSALDWAHIPDVEDDEEGIVAENERRLARMAAFVRAMMVPFLAIPLFGWGRLVHPSLAVVALAASVVEAAWFVHRVWTRHTIRGDRLLAAVDVGFCIALMAIGSRAAAPELRNVVMTEVVPFSLIASLTVAFAIGFRVLTVAAVLLMWVSWGVTIYPDVTLKLGSDLLGFVMWYTVGLYVSYLLRTMAARTAQATADQRRAQAVAAEQQRLLDLQRQRERMRSGLHDRQLPILDGLSADPELPPEARRLIRRAALAARALLGTVNDRDFSITAQLIELTDTFLELRLPVHPKFFIDAEPPAGVAEVMVAATGEALSNAHKYAGRDVEVHLLAEASDGRFVVSVVDHGAGFDPATVRRGDGLGRTFPAVEKCGGRYEITSAPGVGTTVRFEWPGDQACEG